MDTYTDLTDCCTAGSPVRCPCGRAPVEVRPEIVAPAPTQPTPSRRHPRRRRTESVKIIGSADFLFPKRVERVLVPIFIEPRIRA